jgi:hypothetical protein
MNLYIKRNNKFSSLKIFYTRHLSIQKKLPFLKKGQYYSFFVSSAAKTYFNIRGQLIYRRYKSSTLNSTISLLGKISKETIIYTVPLYLPKLGF